MHANELVAFESTAVEMRYAGSAKEKSGLAIRTFNVPTPPSFFPRPNNQANSATPYPATKSCSRRRMAALN